MSNLYLSHDALATSSPLLLAVATKLKIPGLISHCEDYIGETLTPDTVAEMFNLAVQIKSDRLASCCSDFISAHINCVLSTNTLHNLNSDTLKNLISRTAILAPTLLNPPPVPILSSILEYPSTRSSFVEHPPQHNKAAEPDEEMKDPTVTVMSVEQPVEKVDESMIGVPSQDLTGSAEDVVDKGLITDANSNTPSTLLGMFQMR